MLGGGTWMGHRAMVMVSHGVQLETACLGDAGVTVSVSAQPAKVIRVALTVPMSEISITIDRRAEIS